MAKRLLALAGLSVLAWLVGVMLWMMVASAQNEMSDAYWTQHGHPPTDMWSAEPFRWYLLLGPMAVVWSYAGWKVLRRKPTSAASAS